MKRIDERDTMFSRMSYKEGTKQYEDYYSRKPDKKPIDDELRSLPQICGEGTATYSEIHSPIADAAFEFLHDIKELAEGKPNPVKTTIDSKAMSEKLKKLAKYFGANLVGIAKMEDYHYYSHRGRHPEVYGEEVEASHKYGIVFAIEMDKEMINRAPQIEELIAVSKGYMDTAILGMWLSYYIRNLGYEARNHMDGNYKVVAPLVAEKAGLGEIGRSGLLITKDYGQRVRLGVVTTDMPLICDEESPYGLKEFCKVCNKCSLTCPGKAIPKEGMKEIDGVMRWQIDQESCYRMWRSLGTDCGICLSSCPFSQGVDRSLADKIMDSKDAVAQILVDHKEKHGIRPYIRQPLDIVK